MAGKTPRVRAAQEALDAAIRELIEASDEMDLAYARRTNNPEQEESLLQLRSSVLTHWAVATSRTVWKRDKDDPEDTTEYPSANVSALVRDDTMPAWMLAGLLRRAASVADDYL